MFYRQLIYTSSNQQIEYTRNRQSCLCYSRTKSWGHTRSLVRPRTNSCLRADRQERCIAVILGYFGPRHTIPCLRGTTTFKILPKRLAKNAMPLSASMPEV